MKKIMLLAFAGILSAYSVNAQTENSSKNKKTEQNHKKVTKWQKENLTPEQRKKANEEREKFKTQREAIKNNPSLSEEQKKERMRELSQEERNKINGILAPAQRGKFKEFKTDTSTNRKDRMEKLDLSEDQKAKMNRLREVFKSESKKIRENTALSEEQRTAQLKELREKNKSEMNDVLNKEQKEKMKNFRKNRGK